MIIGAIQAYNEAENIGGAIESLYEAGVERVVVLDGAWTTPDGATFGGGQFWSTDDMFYAADELGASVVFPIAPFGGDGGKRDLLVRCLGVQAGAAEGDHVFILDADERVSGTLDEALAPEGHGVVMLRNLRPNDIPEIRGNFPHGDYGHLVPLIRWLRWSPQLSCVGAGRYVDADGPIQVYKDQYLDHLPPADTVVLPILKGVEILHSEQPTPERIAAKRDHYGRLRA